MDQYQKKHNILVIFSIILASVLWYVLFVVTPINFWLEMSISIFILVIVSILSGYRLPQLNSIKIRHIIIGVVSAAILYFIFYMGNIISGYLFPLKDSQISSIYSNRSEGSLVLIGLLLLFIIGPGEEIFWRGFIQKTFSQKFGINTGYFSASLIYAGVHIITGNFMLIIAALICGLYWGWIYKKEKSLVPVIISHGIWDLTIFVIFPIMV